MRSWNRWAAVLLAVAGAGLCLAALIGFLATVSENNLPWPSDQTAREHYLAVGDSYGQGFTVGFFLCFFLTLIAVSARALVQERSRVGKAGTRREPPGRPVLTR